MALGTNYARNPSRKAVFATHVALAALAVAEGGSREAFVAGYKEPSRGLAGRAYDEAAARAARPSRETADYTVVVTGLDTRFGRVETLTTVLRGRTLRAAKAKALAEARYWSSREWTDVSCAVLAADGRRLGRYEAGADGRPSWADA